MQQKRLVMDGLEMGVMEKGVAIGEAGEGGGGYGRHRLTHNVKRASKRGVYHDLDWSIASRRSTPRSTHIRTSEGVWRRFP